MSELATDFNSLPAEYQSVIRLAQERHHIEVTPLQTLAGGWSGALVFLVSVGLHHPERIEHLILKLDRKNERSPADETHRHTSVMQQSPPDFVNQHLAQMAFERVEAEGALAIFYSIAGQSLSRYRTLSAYDKPGQVETIFAHTYQYLLNEWNAARTFKQAVHPTSLLKEWLEFRLKPGNQIEKYLENVLQVPFDLAGFLIQGSIFPNPLAYARKAEWWGVRPIDAVVGLQHGDLNTNNILVKFAKNEATLEGYYLIDFALFREKMPLLLDLRYLEMSYLILRQARVSLPAMVDLIARLGEADSLEPEHVPVDVAGVGAIIGSTRREFERWVTRSHPSLHDDLWGQYWLAGVAAGLSYCHKAMLGEAERLTGLVYAAANLKRYAALFGMPTPTEGRQLYDPAVFRQDRPGAATPAGSPRQAAATAAPATAKPLPVGEVTFVFTDIEGSTPLWENQPEQMREALEVHNATVQAAVAAHGGQVFKVVGDAFNVAFSQPANAIAAVVEAQRRLKSAPWGPLGPLRVRIGVHLGHAELHEGEYVSSHTFNRVARIMSAGHGGQILISSEVMEKIRAQLPADVTLRDMGQHRLRGLTRLEHLFQVATPDLPADFPKLATLNATPNNLPTQLTDFIGRAAELAALKDLLANSRNRLITIIAPGGMGKTRLALETAEQMHQAYPQGVYFVPLERISAADQIVQSVAEGLPISLASQEDPKARVIDFLRDKQILLVMDNFEHVLDGALLVHEMLGAAPRVQVLTTSRFKLNLTGEMTFTLEGLGVDEAAAEVNSALQLFAQSAQRVRPNFDLNPGVLPAVTRVCRLVEGMPLAIVLAAAWIDTLSVDEIAAEIEKSIDILETDKRDVAARQRSVRAVIESSWNHVDAAAQNLLKRLAVFRGGLTRAAAQEAAGATLRSLSQLVDKALLRRDTDTGRYHLHELVRQYAEEQLALLADLERVAHAAHASYFADSVQASVARLHGHQCQAALLDIGADIDNIRVAWNYWTSVRDGQRLMQFVDALWMFFEVRGAYAPAIQFFDEAAQKLRAGEPELARVRAHLRARQAWFTALIGLPADGLRLAQESLATLRQWADPEISVGTLQCVTINAIFLNQIKIVIPVAEEMRARTDSSGGEWERGFALIWSAYAQVMQGQIGAALEAGQQSLAIFEKLANPFGACVASGLVLGSIAMAMGDRGAAKSYFLRGVEGAREINYTRLLQVAYDNLGTVALIENEVAQAQELFANSLRISRESGQTREMLASVRDFAMVSMAQGDLELALRLLAVVLKHPASEQNSLNRPERLRDETEKLRAQIETQLDPALYRSAWEMGQGWNLAAAAEQILS